jgi:glycosyltransferase involved in cell wall biosynthesis
MKSSLSIVVPHKDSLDKLERLLHSIPDEEGVEVVVVDDNSAASEKAERLAGTFPRVLFLENQSGENNAGQARNIGLREATGEWVFFADADDFFVPGAFPVIDEALVSVGEDTDIVFFNVTSMNEETGKQTWRHNSVARIFSKEDETAREKTARYDWTQPWGKAVRTRMIRERNIAFDSVPVSNDVIFSQKCGHHARGVKLDSRIVYCIIEASGTLSATTTEDQALTRLQVRINSGRNIMQWGVDWPFSWGAKWFFASRPLKLTRRKIALYSQYAGFVVQKVIYGLKRKKQA